MSGFIRGLLAGCMLLVAGCGGGGGSSSTVHADPIIAALEVAPPRYGWGAEFPFEGRNFQFSFSGTIPQDSFWRLVFYNNSGLERLTSDDLQQGETYFFPPQAEGTMFARAELFGFTTFGAIESFGVWSNEVSFEVGVDYEVDFDIVSGSDGALSIPGWSAETVVQLSGAYFGQEFDLLFFDSAQNLVPQQTPNGALGSYGGQLSLYLDDFLLGVNYVQIVTDGLPGDPPEVLSPLYPVLRPTNPLGCTFGFNLWQGGGGISQAVPKTFPICLPTGEFHGGGQFNCIPLSWDALPVNFSVSPGVEEVNFFYSAYPNPNIGEVVAVQQSLTMTCGTATTSFMVIPVRAFP